MHLLPSLVPLSLGYQHGKATVRAKACGHAWASARASSDANLYPGLFATALKYDDALTCPFNHSPPDLTLRRYPKHGLRGIGLAPSICKISNHRLRSASKFHSGLSPTPTISSRASQLLADLSTKTAGTRAARSGRNTTEVQELSNARNAFCETVRRRQRDSCHCGL